MNLKSVETIVCLITFLSVYIVSCTSAGAFRAWVAKMMGDDTAEEAGFLSLNPFVHIDFLGLVFLLLTYFGWGKSVPIEPANIDGSIKLLGIKSGWRTAKLFTVFFSDSCMYFFFALVSLICLVVIFGAEIFFVSATMLKHWQCMSHLFMIQALPTYSSFSLVIGFILIVTAYVTILLGVLDTITNACRLAITLVTERSGHEDLTQYNLIAFIVPLILIVCCARAIRFFVIDCMLLIGWAIARLLGVI